MLNNQKLLYIFNIFHFKCFWIIILAIFIAELLCVSSLFRTLILNVYHQITTKDSNFFLTIITAIYVFFTIRIFYANQKSVVLLQQQLNSQKEQWLRSGFIKYECDIITKARELFKDVEGDISSFEGFFLSRFSFRVDEETNKIRLFPKNDYDYYNEKFTKLSKYYAENQTILDACGLQEGFFYFRMYCYLLLASKNAFEKDPNLTITKSYRGLQKALFWYTFPVLIHKRLKEGLIVSNPNYEQCYQELTPKILDEYYQFLRNASISIHSMGKIFDQIITINLRELTVSKELKNEN